MKTRLFTVFAIVALIVVGYRSAQAAQVLGTRKSDRPILDRTSIRFFVTDLQVRGDPKLGSALLPAPHTFTPGDNSVFLATITFNSPSSLPGAVSGTSCRP